MKYMNVADKQTWSSMVYERMKQEYPTLIKFNTNKQQSMFSAMGLVDLMAYNEAKSGNPDANYVKNVFALIGKYTNQS